MPERRRRRAAGALVLAGAVGLVGCASSDHMYLLRREVRCSALGDPVEFLPRAPERAYVEVARIEASGGAFVPTSWETLRIHLCREALAVEADAVVDMDQGHIDYGIGFTPFKVDWTHKKLTATAIRYLEPGQQPEEVEAPAVDRDGPPASE